VKAAKWILRLIRGFRLYLIILALLLVIAFIGKKILGKDTLDCWTLGSLFFLTKEYTLMTERQPSDRKLIKIFEENRGVFEHLRLMAFEDGRNGKVFSVDNRENGDANYTGSGGLSTLRRSEYMRLLSSIRPRPGLCVIPNHYVDFPLASGGMGPLGIDWDKGIRYIPDNPAKEGLILKDLDSAKKGDGDELLRQIDDHWFLYYESY
jgi:hypothetical protein